MWWKICTKLIELTQRVASVNTALTERNEKYEDIHFLRSNDISSVKESYRYSYFNNNYNGNFIHLFNSKLPR